MNEFKDGYIVIIGEMSGLRVLGVVEKQEEAERLAKQHVEQSNGHWKAYVLRVSAAFEAS